MERERQQMEVLYKAEQEKKRQEVGGKHPHTPRVLRLGRRTSRHL